MRLLVATEETQGRRPTDYFCCEEGEVVTFGSECTRETVDGPCGCRRGLAGLKSSRAATTFRVVEFEHMDPPALAELLASVLVAQGFYASPTEALDEAAETASRLAKIASDFPVGTVLERRGDMFGPRLRMVG
jgi:hypothetical protein